MTPIASIGAIGAGGSMGGWTTVNGEPRYVVQAGDTLGAIARKYLGDGNRYMEIWNAQPDTRTGGRSPDDIMVGESLVMPLEAVDTARALGMLGDDSASYDAPAADVVDMGEADSWDLTAKEKAAEIAFAPTAYADQGLAVPPELAAPQQAGESIIEASPLPLKALLVAGLAAATVVGAVLWHRHQTAKARSAAYQAA